MMKTDTPAAKQQPLPEMAAAVEVYGSKSNTLNERKKLFTDPNQNWT
jgi:hypothetical protein